MQQLSQNYVLCKLNSLDLCRHKQCITLEMNFTKKLLLTIACSILLSMAYVPAPLQTYSSKYKVCTTA